LHYNSLPKKKTPPVFAWRRKKSWYLQLQTSPEQTPKDALLTERGEIKLRLFFLFIRTAN